MQSRNKKKLAYFILIASIVLLIANCYALDYHNLQNGNYWGITSNLILIGAMILNIRILNKKEKK